MSPNAEILVLVLALLVLLLALLVLVLVLAQQQLVLLLVLVVLLLLLGVVVLLACSCWKIGFECLSAVAVVVMMACPWYTVFVLHDPVIDFEKIVHSYEQIEKTSHHLARQ